MGRKWTVPALLMCALLLATGCSSGHGGRAGAKTSAGSDLSAAAVQVAQCMRGKGFDVPDPTFDAAGAPNFHENTADRGNPAYEDARAICRRPFNDAWTAAGRPNTKQQGGQDLLAYAQCLRAHGVDVADPDSRGNWALDKQLLDSPAWTQANKACADKLPSSVRLPGAGQ